MESLLWLVIWLLIIGVIIGLLFWVVSEAPFVPPQFKQIIRFVIVVVAVILLIGFLLQIAPTPSFKLG